MILIWVIISLYLIQVCVVNSDCLNKRFIIYLDFKLKWAFKMKWNSFLLLSYHLRKNVLIFNLNNFINSKFWSHETFKMLIQLFNFIYIAISCGLLFSRNINICYASHSSIKIVNQNRYKGIVIAFSPQISNESIDKVKVT